MKNVIITGANGFIGSQLVKKMVENEIRVVAIDISFTESQLPESDYIYLIEDEIKYVDSLMELIPQRDYDAFYHLAWAGVNGQDKASPEVQLKNIEMSINCASIAKRLNCKKILFAGTIAERVVDSLPRLQNVGGGMMYGVAKHACHIMIEAYCKNINLDFVWMQFSNIYGANNKTGNLVSYTIGELTNGRVANFGPACQPYDFIFINDLLEAVFRLGDRETKCNCYFIGSGTPRMLKNYLYEIGTQFGRIDLIKVGERPDDGVVYSEDMFDITLLIRDIGEYISMSFDDGIKFTIDNYNNR